MPTVSVDGKYWFVKVHQYSARWDSNIRKFVPEHFVGVTFNLGPFRTKEMAERAEHIALVLLHNNQNRRIVEHSVMMKYRMDNHMPDPMFCIVTHVHAQYAKDYVDA